MLFHKSLFAVLAVKRPQLRGLGRYKKRMEKKNPKRKTQRKGECVLHRSKIIGSVPSTRFMLSMGKDMTGLISFMKQSKCTV